MTNIYRDVILDEKQLPIKNCAYTQCFRREAGSYGKDVRGLNRLHEFSKVEIVRIDTPEHSRESHKEMLEHVEGLLQKLELPYRILHLCGGDMSFTAATCFDFEVYSEAQKRWLGVSSVSNFDTYQANRLKCRYRTAEKKTELCHTLNGSALALPRIVAALLENNQTPEGIRIPKALVPYCGLNDTPYQPADSSAKDSAPEQRIISLSQAFALLARIGYVISEVADISDLPLVESAPSS